MDEINCTVSVIIPVKNAENSLARSLESLVQQTQNLFEVVVVNNNCTDSSISIAKSFAKKLPIRIIECSVPGSGAARNAGIMASGGRFIAFLDADDVWYPEKIQIQLLARRNSLYYFSGTFMHYLTPQGRVLGDNVRYKNSESAARDLREGATVPTPLSSILVSRELIDRAGLFNEAFRRSQDFEWMLRLSQHADLEIPSRVPMVGYVIAGGTSTDTGYVEQALAADAVRNGIKTGNAPDYQRDVICILQESKIPRKYLAGKHYRRAGILIGNRQYVLALLEMAKSLLLSPKETIVKLRWQVFKPKISPIPASTLRLFAEK